MTSHLRHHYVAPFIFFSVALNVKMNYARNYKNLVNFVKVMLKILVVPFFTGHSVRACACVCFRLHSYLLPTLASSSTAGHLLMWDRQKWFGSVMYCCYFA